MKTLALIAALFLFASAASAQEYQVVDTEIKNISTTLATSAETNPQTYALRLVSSVAAYISIQISGISTAATSPVYLPANLPFETRIVGKKIIVVQTPTGAGILSIIELSK